jgi:hypothetical protein
VDVEQFWQLFKENIIIQAVLALMFGGTACYLYAAQHPVPMELVALLSVILGYFFGSKTQSAALKGQIDQIKVLLEQDPRLEGILEQARDARIVD